MGRPRKIIKRDMEISLLKGWFICEECKSYSRNNDSKRQKHIVRFGIDKYICGTCFTCKLIRTQDEFEVFT